MSQSNLRARSIQRTAGFTLIELLIVVVIAGILAGIAYPNYQKYVRQTRRTDAQVALTQVANLQERFFTECNHYARVLTGTRACGTAGATTSILGYHPSSNLSPDGNYAIAITAGTITGSCTTFSCGYTLTATPVAGGPQAGDGAFQIDALNNKRWDKNNDNNYGTGENSWK